MPCDTRKSFPEQTLSQRKEEVRVALDKLMAALTSGRARALIGPTGAVAFPGWIEEERGRVSDTCAYRLVMTMGSASAKAAIARAEALSGRSVNRQAVAAGHHSHDGGASWHDHK